MHLGVDGVLTVTVRIPGGRVPLAVPSDEPGALLVVEHLDAFRAVDLGNARELAPTQPPELDRHLHHRTACDQVEATANS